MNLLLAVSLGISLVCCLPVSIDLENPEEAGFFEGDIEIEPGEEPYHRNAVADHRLLWPHGIVPFAVDSTHSKYATHIKTFHDAMNEIMEKTKVNGKKCIDFPQRTHESAYIQFSDGTGCHTPIGYHNAHRSDVTIGNGCLSKGTVMHEILHALGFWHEQSRADRDSYVTIHFNNIQKGHESNFNKYSLGTIDHLHMPYDYGSIMHYPAYAFAIDRHQTTIDPKQSGVTIGQRIALSSIDIKEIQTLYGCIPRTRRAFVTTDQDGLKDQYHPAPEITHVAMSNPHLQNAAATCTFDSGLCGWLQSSNDDIDWSSAHGEYLFLQAIKNPNQTAILISPTFHSGTYCFSAWYIMNGSEMEYLFFETLIGGRTYILGSFTGNQGDKWNHFQVKIDSRDIKPLQFLFGGRTGSTYNSYLAVDDVSVTPGSCHN